jgi:hypothetical protein
VTVKRVGLLAALTAVLLAATACGSKDPAPTTTTPNPSGTTTATGSATPSVTGSPQTLVEFSVDGAGPYVLGKTLDQLKVTPGLEEVVTGGQTCKDNTTARGTGVWRDIRLSFRKDGKLYLLVNRSAAIPTPSGAYLGTPLAQLKAIYAGVTNQELTRGTASALLVTTLSGGGILFDLDPSKKVMTMIAGDSNYLRSSYQAGTDFC